MEADYATDILAAIADTDDELDVFASDFESDFRFLKMKSYAYDEYAEVA
ncbi:MAG: hypothetical protein LBP53_05420 [Candidatus Peribacteria bacterium]|nr:hypothetical protein [Candidatus Peribacteria bacterium]